MERLEHKQMTMQSSQETDRRCGMEGGGSGSGPWRREGSSRGTSLAQVKLGSRHTGNHRTQVSLEELEDRPGCDS